MAKDDPLLTQRQAAEYLNLSIRTLQRVADRGDRPALDRATQRLSALPPLGPGPLAGKAS
jgi:hypothetical protein